MEAGAEPSYVVEFMVRGKFSTPRFPVKYRPLGIAEYTSLDSVPKKTYNNNVPLGTSNVTVSPAFTKTVDVSPAYDTTAFAETSMCKKAILVAALPAVSLILETLVESGMNEL